MIIIFNSISKFKSSIYDYEDHDFEDDDDLYDHFENYEDAIVDCKKY